MKTNKKKHLRKWVRVTLAVSGYTLAIVAGVALMMYVMFGAVLQTSYRLDRPSASEVQEARDDGGLFAHITLAHYDE